MDKHTGSVIGLRQYLKNVIQKPTANIRSNMQITWLKNLIFLVIFIFLSGTAGMFIRANLFPEPDDQYLQVFSLVELLMIIFLVYFSVTVIPMLFINMVIIYLLTKRRYQSHLSFQKVFSDHTNIFIYSFILFVLGSLSLSFSLVTANDTLLSFILYLIALIVYVGGSILMIVTYVRGHKKLNLILLYLLIFISLGFLYYIISASVLDF